MTAIITEAIRNPQARRQSQSKLPLRAGEQFIKFVVGEVFVFIKVICRMWKWSLKFVCRCLADRKSISLGTLSGAMRGACQVTDAPPARFALGVP